MTEETKHSVEWHKNGAEGLEKAVASFKMALPGWWFTVCECQVSCEARIAPTTQSQHIDLIRCGGDVFDEGFDVSIPQPSSCAQALNEAVRLALKEIEKRK